MSDDIQDNTDVQESQLSTVEERAAARGWRPQEEWEGEPDEWVDARTFVQKGELMDTIHAERKRANKLEKELGTVKSSVDEIRSHYEKMAKAEVEKTLKELKAKRRDALRIDDHETVDEIEEQIEEIKTEKSRIDSAKETNTPAPLPPEVQSWLGDNPWADENSSTYDAELASEALALLQLEVNRGGYAGKETLNKVKGKVERLYPEKFNSKTRTTTSIDSSDVSTRGNTGPKGGKLASRLTDEQKDIGKKFVSLGAVKSLEDYAKQLNDMGELR